MTEEQSDISLKDIQNTSIHKHRSASVRHAEFGNRLLIGLGLSCLIGFVGWRKDWLSGSGFAGAVVTGTITTAFGGYGHAALLVGFFASSSGMSRIFRRTRHPLDQITARGDRRDILQVAANGGAPTAITLFGRRPAWRAAYVGSLAAVTGDTWATEIGGRFGGQPRHIIRWTPAPAGISGGVTLPGTVASAAGGAFIGLLAGISGRSLPEERRQMAILGLAAGTAGSLIDSLVGATLQERRWCDACGMTTEREIHSCGERTRHVGGVLGVTNDTVNLICSLSGALIARAIQYSGICR